MVITIYVAVIAQIMGVVLGILSALAGMSKNRTLRAISGVYVWFFRGTPVLVQIFLVYFGTPYLFGGIDLFPNHVHIGFLDLQGAIMAGLVALGINEGAYMSEIVRAGILSVDPGQTEAAKSLGMTYRLTMSRIVLPQALRVIVPPLGNEFNNMIKTTSLLSIIAVGDLFRFAQAMQLGDLPLVRGVLRGRPLLPAPDHHLELDPEPDRAPARARAPGARSRPASGDG